ncbi:MAG: PKD domain-containing protein [Candidatus Methanoperedens sp.]|nr:PKD domain-containing protein [Candidatus Methanoperedens sp.]
MNFLKWDGTWTPKDELNISNGSWPYRYSENETTADFQVDDTTLSIPKYKTKFKLKQNSISYSLTYSKSELESKQKPINLTDAFIDLHYSLKSDKPKNKYIDKHKIKYDRFEFNAGEEHISVHDDTLREYTEGGTVYQDVTYLFPDDYDFGIDNNGEIRLKFKKEALNKLTGNVIIDIRTWDIIGPFNWGGNVTFSQATDVKATGNAELEQTISDYALYTRFDEDDGATIYERNRSTIYNEKTSNVPLGELYLNDAYTNPYTAGKYGQAIHFDGQKNKVIFPDHADFRLPDDFTISLYLKLAPGIDNNDTDITRKGSTATVEPDSWWKVEIKDNIIQGVVYNKSVNGTEIPEKDTQERRDGLWHFVAYTRERNTCSLFVDDIVNPVASISDPINCSTGTGNTGLLAIGAKDTEESTTGPDYTNGTIDEVRFFNRKLSASDLASIQNNEHYLAGTVTRNLSSLIRPWEELNESGCDGIWDNSTTKVDILVSTDNTTWDEVKSNVTSKANYSIKSENNYTYLRCSLSTTDSSQTPIIESIRARIRPKGTAYTISLSTLPPGLTPEPEGAGEYPLGHNLTVSAQNVLGYTFQNWTENGILVSTSSAYQFNITRDRNLVAEYAQNPEYTIFVSTSPSGLTPQPAGGGQYLSGQIATVTAQPVYGYTFQKWTENGNLVSTNLTYQFTVTGNRTLVAEYAPVYTISLSTLPPGLTPQPTGAGEYLYGEKVTVTAQPVSGYSFWHWTENGIQVSTNPAYQFNVTGHRNIVAEYTQNSSLVGWWKFDNDILDWSGNRNDGICSGSGCPTPTTGKIGGALYFDGNDYIDAGNGERLNITGNITIEAWVRPARRDTQYIVKKAANDATNGYELSLASSGKAFFRFNQRTSGNNYRVDSAINYPSNNTTWVHLVGIYNGTQLQIYLNGNLSNNKNGTSNISSNKNNLTIGGPDDSKYLNGSIDEVRIWNRALTPQEVEAFYNGQNPVYTISVSTSPSGLTPQPAGGGQYPFGQKATVTAQPVYGYIFRNWTEDGSQVSTSPSYQFMVTEDRNLVAMFIPNSPPVPEAGGPYTVNEGSSVTLDASGSSDPDGDTLTYAWDLDNDGIYENPGVTAAIIPPDGNATITVGLQVSDGNGGVSTDTATVTVINVAPTVGPITAPINPTSAGTAVAASATFTDPGTADTHTTLWNWGDGTTSQGTVTETSAKGSHIYTTAGIYTVTLTVTDDDGGAGSATYMYVVIYDPNAGFVTGGGWINSPVGAYMAYPNLTGHANININSKYQKGAQVPIGVTEFQFEVANLNFHSTAYEWLVVTGTRAQYKGTGTINGMGEYGFMLTAIDGTPDRFRIKIWNKANEEILYDNKIGSSDTGNDAIELGGGSIVIHSK